MRLAIYNAGTDIVSGDPLGRMRVSPEGVLERDKFVLDELVQHRIPTVVLTSGGYTSESYHLISGMVAYVLGKWGAGLREVG